MNLQTPTLASQSSLPAISKEELIALYEETANGPYPARSVKCIDEIAVESEKLRVNPFSDLMNKIFGFFKK